MTFAQAIVLRAQQQADRVERSRAEFNFQTIQAKIPRGSKVLDVGAWSCYLGEMLRDRLGCDVLSLDVVDANKTDMPFQVFDGQKLPVEPQSYDVVLLLYVLHHAKDDAPLLREAARALRDGGRLLVAEDSVDGLWNRILTVGFHGWLWLVTRMSRDGRFRTTGQWRERFAEFRLRIDETLALGHHLGKTLWPRNMLFVLGKDAPRD